MRPLIGLPLSLHGNPRRFWLCFSNRPFSLVRMRDKRNRRIRFICDYSGGGGSSSRIRFISVSAPWGNGGGLCERRISVTTSSALTSIPWDISSTPSFGDGRSNREEGIEVAYLGFAAQPAFRSPGVFELFTAILKTLGYQDGFVPIEKLAG